MKVVVYRADDGKFMLGDESIERSIKNLIDVKELINKIDIHGIWIFIKFYRYSKQYIIASRFDKIKQHRLDRLDRYVAITVCEGESIYELYKKFLEEFRKILIEKGWEWLEGEIEEPVKFREFEVIGNEIEGILKDYPSISDRLEMVKLAEKVLQRYSCVLYSKTKPRGREFERCFWISSQRIERDKIDIQVERLKNAIERDDLKTIKEISRREDFPKLIEILNKRDRLSVKTLFYNYINVIFEHLRSYPEHKLKMRDIGYDYISRFVHELEEVFGISRARTSIPITTWEPSRRESSGIKLFIVVIAFIFVSLILYMFLYPLFSPKPIDVRVVPRDGQYYIYLNATEDLKGNLPILVGIFNETSIIKIYNGTISPNKTEIIAWKPYSEGIYHVIVDTSDERIYSESIDVAGNKSKLENTISRLLRSIFKDFNISNLFK